MRTLKLSIVAALSLLVLASPALATYPKTISAAVKKAYAPQKVKLNGPACKKTFGNQLYALVAVTYVKSGKASTIAFQFVNTAGWFAMWKDGKVLPAVVKDQRARVRTIVNKLRARCA